MSWLMYANVCSLALQTLLPLEPCTGSIESHIPLQVELCATPTVFQIGVSVEARDVNCYGGSLLGSPLVQQACDSPILILLSR